VSKALDLYASDKARNKNQSAQPKEDSPNYLVLLKIQPPSNINHQTSAEGLNNQLIIMQEVKPNPKLDQTKPIFYTTRKLDN